MELVESPRPCDPRSADAIHESAPTLPGRRTGGFASDHERGQKSTLNLRRINVCGGNAKTAQRRISTWANLRTLVHEPGRTGHRAARPVDVPLLRPLSSSGYGGGAGGKLRLRSQPELPATVRGPASFVVRDSLFLLRVPGPHDRRKRINLTGDASKRQVGAALSADRTLPAGV